MNYIPSGRSRLYRSITQISSCSRYALLTLACGVTGFVWFYMCYQPLEKYIQCYTARIDALNTKSLHYKEQCAKNAQLHETMGTLQQTIRGTTTPVVITSSQYAITILEHALTVGLLPTTYTQEAQQENSWAYFTCMHFIAQGTIGQLHAFLTALARDEHLIVQCSHLELSHVQSNIFSCSCTFNTYIRKSACP